MSLSRITKKHVAAAAAVLSVGGAGLTMSGLGDTSVQIRARTPDRPSDAVVREYLHDAADSDRVRSLGWGRFRVDRDVDTATARWSFDVARDASQADALGGGNGAAPNESTSVSVPRTLVLGLPSYEGGRAPSATAPTVDMGTAPSVDPGWTTTVHLGEEPSVGSPSVDPGEMGTVNPPTLEID